jgi:hypothetical protein
MQLYSEFVEGNRKAVVSLVNASAGSQFHRFGVEMFDNGRLVQKTLTLTQGEADQLAEDFVKGFNSGSPTLLTEANG